MELLPMMAFRWIAGAALAFVWIWRLCEAAIGIRRVPELTDPQWNAPLNQTPRVSIIVPARNEDAALEPAMRSLLALDYPDYEVIAVNDRSTDSTGEIMDRLRPESGAKLRIIHVDDLPGGWLGKPHAMWRGAQQASGEWLLFTDADVLFRSDALRRAVACAESLPTDHFVLFPTMVMKSAGERMMIAFFQCFFLFGYRAWKIPDPRSRDHLGVGAFNMLRRSAYETIGTFEALRMEVVEDMKVGKLVKEHRLTQRAAFGRDLLRIHWASGALGIVRNLSKNFFAFMKFEWWRALGACGGLSLLTLGPFVGLAFAPGWSKLSYSIATLAIFLTYVGMSRKCDIPAYFFVLHPIGGVLFVYTILRSMVITLWNGGVTWRGTRYPLEELRKGLV
jgi:glycosyltransferase involved in cell wall biosynthesis